MLRTAFPSMTRFPGTTHAPWCRSETCWKDGRGPTAGLMPGSTTACKSGVGGSMLPMSSPNDPIFMLHHCNVDRIWASGSYSTRPRTSIRPAGAAAMGHNFDDVMIPWGRPRGPAPGEPWARAQDVDRTRARRAEPPRAGNPYDTDP